MLRLDRQDRAPDGATSTAPVTVTSSGPPGTLFVSSSRGRLPRPSFAESYRSIENTAPRASHFGTGSMTGSGGRIGARCPPDPRVAGTNRHRNPPISSASSVVSMTLIMYVRCASVCTIRPRACDLPGSLAQSTSDRAPAATSGQVSRRRASRGSNPSSAFSRGRRPAGPGSPDITAASSRLHRSGSSRSQQDPESGS